ncbi:hypothetical protein LV779_11395 [Streptomyces thinghirensis]|nr:hypothetical protein [Streptomyces thinghirensis]
MDPTLVLGFVTEEGGPTSHSAILARALRCAGVVALPGAGLSCPRARSSPWTAAPARSS